MSASLRNYWDIVKDCKKPISPVHEFKLWNEAVAKAIPDFRAKLVMLPNGQSELSVTPTNQSSVINARMNFNPLLDCPRTAKRTDEEQAEVDKENKQRSAKRARQSVRWLTKSVMADHMLTFSYRENITDRVEVAKNWKEFVRLFRVRYPDWGYVAVLEKQDRGSLHIHVAVSGRQDIRWLLRCWLIAIGQPLEDVSEWLLGGLKLAERSLGAVNVEPPKRRWGSGGKNWKRDKLASYLTKYIGKEFEESDKNAKKYWHSKNIVKPVIERFWLKANNFDDAIREARDLIYYTGATSLSFWGDDDAKVIWVTGETSREHVGLVRRCEPDFDLLED